MTPPILFYCRSPFHREIEQKGFITLSFYRSPTDPRGLADERQVFTRSPEMPTTADQARQCKDGRWTFTSPSTRFGTGLAVWPGSEIDTFLESAQRHCWRDVGHPCFQAGYKAGSDSPHYLIGATLTEAPDPGELNPHPPGSAEHFQWLQGWSTAIL